MKIEWQEWRLSDVLSHFTKDFKPKKGERIITIESYVDPTKGVVVFKFYVDVEEKSK